MLNASLFSITAAADPSALSRLLELFALRGLTPHMVEAISTGGLLRISIEQADLDDHQASIILEKMRTLILVRRAELNVTPVRKVERLRRVQSRSGIVQH